MTAASFVLCLAPVNTAKWISRSLLGLAWRAQLHGESARVVTPPAGKLYHGFYWGGVGTDEHDPTEHDVTPEDVGSYEKAVGKRSAWIYFSNNWFESRKFPVAMCSWIPDLKKMLYVSSMLRYSYHQK